MSQSFESLKPVRIAPATVALVAVKGILRQLMTAAVAWNHRRQFASLGNLDDRMLADLGLTRGDIGAAVAEPLWRDPTVRLSVLSIERRAAERDYARWRNAKAAEVKAAAQPKGRSRETCSD